SHSGLRRSHRRSLREVINGALNKFINRTPTNTPQSETAVFSTASPVLSTLNTKCKLPAECRTHQISSVEVGKTGCFSPKVTKNEAVRKFLHLRFSLGRSRKDPNFVTQSAEEVLESSQEALHITQRRYLKRDWCKTQPLKQTICDEACGSRTIINRFCYEQCNSSYIPRHEEEAACQAVALHLHRPGLGRDRIQTETESAVPIQNRLAFGHE
uniref:DAN domain-containing protein n=1 Tax=Denticeps clupeoides TaxID=299321 RepID=A0AAY4EJ06_9TELE